MKNSENHDFPVYLDADGPFKDSISLGEQEFVLGPLEIRCVNYTITLPDRTEEFGKSTTYIWAKQKSGDGGAISIATNVPHKISVTVPYPERYVTMSVHTEDVNENEPVQFRVSVRNMGNMSLEQVHAQIDVYGADDYSNHVATVKTDTRRIESLQTADLYAYLKTEGLAPGYYKAHVALSYDSEHKAADAFFRIGTLFVRLTNYTKEAVAGKINPYEIRVQSRWNNRIRGVHAKLSLAGASLTTPTVGLDPWEFYTFRSYLDLTNAAAGTYRGRLTLVYDNHSDTQEITVQVTEPTPVKETPSEDAAAADGIFTAQNFLILLVLLVVAADIIYLATRRKKHGS